MVSGSYPPFTRTVISCTPPPSAATVPLPRDRRKYQRIQPIAAAPRTVTTISAGSMAPPALLRLDAHRVERPPHEHHRDQEEDGRDRAGQRAAPLRGERHRELHGEQAEEGGELDDGVHGHGRGVLEGIA